MTTPARTEPTPNHSRSNTKICDLLVSIHKDKLRLARLVVESLLGLSHSRSGCRGRYVKGYARMISRVRGTRAAPARFCIVPEQGAVVSEQLGIPQREGFRHTLSCECVVDETILEFSDTVVDNTQEIHICYL